MANIESIKLPDNTEFNLKDAISGYSTTFNGLSDTNFTSLQNGQVPVYNNVSRKWENASAAGGLKPHVVISTTHGSTVSITKGGTTITPTETSSGIYEADLTDYGTWTATATFGGATSSATISVDTVKIYNVALAYFTATITVTYPAGATCTLSATGQSTQIATTNPYTFTVHAAATYTVTATDGGDTASDTVTITTDGQSESVTLEFAPVVPTKTFAAATDAEIAQMVAAADAGQIDLIDDCGWAVGQEHQVSLSAIAASGTGWTVGEAQAAQTITLVLMHGDREGGSDPAGLPELVTSVTDKGGTTRTTAHFVVGVKALLSATGYMNSTSTNSGSWNACARRGWCNNGFYNALPSDIRPAFKQFKCITAATPSGTTNQTSEDYFALRAEKETLGSATNSNATEAAALTQFQYLNIAANRITSGRDGFRSPYKENSMAFCNTYNGSADYDNASQSFVGYAPFGVV